MACINTSDYCWGDPGWPREWCYDPAHPYVKRICPVTCELCKPASAFADDPCAEASDAHHAPIPGDPQIRHKKPESDGDDDDDDDDDGVGQAVDDHNYSQHQQQYRTVALLFYVIMTLTITNEALL